MKKLFSLITPPLLLAICSIVATAAPVTPTWNYPYCQPWYEYTQHGSSTFGDYDADGWLDLLLTSGNNTTLLKGNGNWDGKIVHNDAGGYEELRSITHGSSAWLDYNNDGNLDFVIIGSLSGAPCIQLYKNNGNNSFTKDETNTAALASAAITNYTLNDKGELVTDNQSRNHFAIADFNNDGWVDLIVNGSNSADGSRKLAYFVNNNGTFALNNNAGLSGIDGGTVWAADFNNDSYMDFAVTGYAYGWQTFIYYNDGDGTFTPTELLNNGYSAGAQYGTLLGMDINNDGWQDIIFGGNCWGDGYTAGMHVFMNNGDGTFGNPVISPGISGWNRYWGQMACGDLNNDGYMDFVFHSNWGNNYLTDCTMLVLNNGDNTFTSVTAGQNGSAREGGIAIFDQNHDGKLDLHVFGYGDDDSQNPAGSSKWFNNFMVNTTNVTAYTAPSVPANVEYVQEGNDVVLVWDAATDAISPVRYNVYAKNKATGAVFTQAPANIETGALKYFNHGAFLTTTTWTFRGLNAAEYEFGVQAVNNGYLASTFAVATERTPATVTAETINVGNWTLSIASNIEATLSYDGRVILNANKAAWGNGAGNASFASLTDVAITKAAITDELGSATEVSISGTDVHGNTVTHRYCLYGSENFVTTDVTVTTANGKVAYNYMSPLTTNGTATMTDASGNVALFVPFDNDAYLNYSTSAFGATNPTSYEVTALFNKTSRNAIVLGSIEHDHWKTGISVATSGNSDITSICAYGGITSYDTRDYLPHGQVRGASVKSPRIMVGCYDDWRAGMEAYGALCNKIAPMWEWEHAKPFVWNSWNVFGSSVTYDNVNTASEYINSTLTNFRDEDGVAYICIDSYWDNLSEDELKQFAANCKASGQKAGIYHTPFVCWAINESGDIWGQPIGTEYENSQLVLRDASGNVVNYRKDNTNGSYANGVPYDPTHPEVHKYLKARLQQFIDWGYEHVKLDFLSHGTMEGKFYDENITTGIEAYNVGMKVLKDFIEAQPKNIHINLSIAPLFPSQYGHSRRISCDASEKIESTKHVLNGTTYGWWLNECYPYNDADGCRLYNGTFGADEGDNRCRVTSAVVTGYLMASDDMSSSSAQSRAKKYINNLLVNDAIRSIKHSFRPIEAIDGDGQADQFVYNDGNNIYIAVYNFGSRGTKTIDYARAGLESGANYEFHELWNDETTYKEGTSYTTASIPADDVLLFKVKKVFSTSVKSVFSNNTAAYYDAAAGTICLKAGEASQAAIYNTTGACVMQAGSHSTLNVQSLPAGVYLYVGQDTDGNTLKCKFIVK